MRDKYLGEERKIIYIEGYYIDYGKFESNFGGQYKCVIGEWDGIENEEDETIFYYFEDRADIQSFMNIFNRTDTEFIITKVMDENYNDITKTFKN
jgi:hypothetical protein